MRSRTEPSFFEVLTAAVADFAERGYDSEDRLAAWLDAIRRAAERDLVPADVLQTRLRESLGTIYSRLVDHGGLVKSNPGVSRFTLARVAPELRAELDRRIVASASLISLDREEAISNTLRRFAGWATSIPPGGSEVVARNPAKSAIRKELARTPFEVRRCVTDQGHKLIANLNDILATNSNAIAARWQHNYVRYPRPNHVARDGKIYLIRGSWAHEKGFVRPGPVGYYDEITKPGEEISCRCAATFLRHLRQLPPDMITNAGREALAAARIAA